LSTNADRARALIEKEILLYLSENKRGYLYRFIKYLNEEKKLSVYKITVSRVLDKLASEGAIRPLKGPRLKGQKKGPFYYLTLVGLLRLLNYGVSSQDLHLIIEKNTDKVPLLFSEWNYFEQKKVAPKIVDAMRYFYFAYVLEDRFHVPNYSRSKKKLSKKKKLPQQQNWLIPRPKLDSAELTRYILFSNLLILTLSGSETEYPHKEWLAERFRRISFEWARIWSGKPRLRQYMIEQLTWKQEKISEKLDRFREVNEYIEHCHSNRD
jgi:hypothetical protein